MPVMKCDFCEIEIDPVNDRYETWSMFTTSERPGQAMVEEDMPVCQDCANYIGQSDLLIEIADLLKTIKPDIDLARAEDNLNVGIERVKSIIKAPPKIGLPAFGRSEAAMFLAIILCADKEGKAELSDSQIAKIAPLTERLVDGLGLFPRKRRKK